MLDINVEDDVKTWLGKLKYLYGQGRRRHQDFAQLLLLLLLLQHCLCPLLTPTALQMPVGKL
jgi:hypothetical protein